MEMFETALGRLVPMNEAQTVLEDAILKLLYDYGTSPQNPRNVPMKLSDIVRTFFEEEVVVAVALDALKQQNPPLVEESTLIEGLPPRQERTFRITGTGVRFVRNVTQGFGSSG